ncbi:hypothetical protein [Dysgonomonas sp. 25]|uniref:hypothetical protein n=1 Tax=Dysgonomonas sp. 25 TaxID=2302933 RepID=UPI0013D54646|nr:hypothetical protein [Dysgonomonas sp. 25]
MPIFYHPEVVCGFEDYAESDSIVMDNPDWMPVLISEYPFKVGYIYKKYLHSLDEFPALGYALKSDNQIAFADEDIEVMVETQLFDATNHIVENDSEGILLVDGERTNISGDYEEYYELKRVSVMYKGKKYQLPEVRINDVFFLNNPVRVERYTPEDVYCPIRVQKGMDDIYYLSINGGDGAESFAAIWVLKDGELCRRYITYVCGAPDLDLVF